MDLIDFAGTQDIPLAFKGRPIHVHNKLISNAFYNPEERRQIAREYNSRIGQSAAPVHLILPNQGIEEWDRPGGDCHDPEGLSTFMNEMRSTVSASVQCSELDCHINDAAFADTALDIFDRWVAGAKLSVHADIKPRAWVFDTISKFEKADWRC